LHFLNLYFSQLWEGKFLILFLYQKGLVDQERQVYIWYLQSIGLFCTKPWGLHQTMAKRYREKISGNSKIHKNSK